MNTPIWFVAAVAAFGTVQWLQLLWDRWRPSRNDWTRQDIARRVGYTPNVDAWRPGLARAEFNVTFHQGGKEVARVNAAGFVVDGRALVNTETFRFKAISSDPVKICIREAQSDVPIGVSVVPVGGSPRQGDEVRIGEVRLGVSL